MSADKESINNNDHSGESKTRVIVKSKKVGYFSKLFGKATPTTNESVIIEENGNIIDIVRVNDERKTYLSFSKKLLSIFGKYKLTQISVDHTPFNISYRFNKNDEYPLLTKDNQKISAFYSLDLQINPSNPVKVLQSFPNNKNITVQDVASMLDQRIRSTTTSSISDVNSTKIRSREFQSSFLNNLAPELNDHTTNLGCEINNWTAPIFGISLQEENQIEIENKKHELQIAEIEKEIRQLNEPEKTQMQGDSINVGRDFIITTNNNNGLTIFIGLVTIISLIVGIIYFVM